MYWWSILTFSRWGILMNTQCLQNEELLFITFVVSWDFVVLSSCFRLRGLTRKVAPLNFSLSLSIHCITVQSIRPAARSNERDLSPLVYFILIRVIISNIDIAGYCGTVEKIEKYTINTVKLATLRRFIVLD